MSKTPEMEEYDEALKNFRAKYSWYMERVGRRMNIYEMDTQDIQGAWNNLVRLRKQLGIKPSGVSIDYGNV